MVIIWGFGAIIDLEWTTKELLVAQKFQELLVILRSAANEINSLPAGCTIFDILAAIKKAALVFLGPDVVQFSDEFLARAILFRLGDIDKERLVGRASEGAEYVEEILSTGWT